MAVTRIQFRRGTTAEWAAENPVLQPGEPGFETDGDGLKIGNGTDAWNALEYFAPGGGDVDVPAGSESVAGILRLADENEASTGLNDTKAMTPLKVAQQVVDRAYINDVPHIEEILISQAAVVRAAASPNVMSLNVVNTGHATLMIAPFPIRILSCHLQFAKGQAADATNYWTISLRGGAENAYVFNTNVGLAASTPIELNPLTSPGRDLNEGEVLLLAFNKSTTSAPDLGGCHATIRYARALT